MKIKLRKVTRATEESIQAAEGSLGHAFPTSYKGFVEQYDGATPETNICRGSGVATNCGVSQFIPVDQITEVRNRIAKILSIPQGAYPIAWAEGGNYVYIGKDEGVFFLDHELDQSSRLASDFTTFLESLEPFDLESIDLKPGQVERAWIDPEFSRNKIR